LLIKLLNSQEAIRVAVDIPSGLFADVPSTGTVFKADHTITFQQPKLTFLFPENHAAVGELQVVDIGLNTSLADDELPATLFLK
jgi:NAD(P)H-hydrate epimerase